jgi:hypothetical protein
MRLKRCCPEFLVHKLKDVIMTHLFANHIIIPINESIVIIEVLCICKSLCSLRRFLRFPKCAARAKAVYFLRVEPQFLENLFVMFSKFRGSFCRYFSDAVHLNRTIDRAFQVPASAVSRNVLPAWRWFSSGSRTSFSVIKPFWTTLSANLF